MKKTILTEKARNNKTAMNAHFVVVLVMLTFCLLQVLGGLQPWYFVVTAAVLGMGPVAAEYIYWRSNKEAAMIKHLVACGFAVFYTYALFTSINNMVFAFVIPMILTISVYNDTSYALKINIGVVLESLIVVILGANTGKYGYSGRDSAIIQVVVVILIGIYSIKTAKALNENNKQKIQNLTDAQNETEHLLYDMSELSEKMKTGIEDIHNQLEKIHVASQTTKSAMEEVTSGATETADAVQQQLVQTEAIQKKVDVVDNVADSITENMQQTLEILHNGSQDMAILVEKVETSVSNSADVAQKLKTLDKYMEEMHSIVELISGITSQTSLLALNASIEAARAGEAGKGFSVVATEISGMASQTREATVHIAELIANVSSAINEVVEVIHQMIDGIYEEKQEAENAAGSLQTIQSNTYSIRDSIDKLAHNIEELKEANNVIVNSIQTISAISEEVSAHASETMNAEEENVATLDRMANRMQQIMQLVNEGKNESISLEKNEK